MAIPAWPLDPVLLLGLHWGVGDGLLEAKVSRGPRRQRPLYSATPEPLQGELFLRTWEWHLLRSFGKSTLEEWSQPFSFPEPGTGGLRTVQFVKPLPMGEFVVTGNYPRGVWKVAVNLETIP